MAISVPRLTVQGVTEQTTRLVVRYQCTAGELEVARSLLRNLAETLALSGARSAFPNPSLGIPASTLAFRSDTTKPPSEIAHFLTCQEIDPRLFQCLRNMIMRVASGNLAINAIVVSDPDSREPHATSIDWPTEENEDAAYPDMARAVRALVEYEDTDFSKSRRCLVELAVEPGAGAVRSFEEWIGPWYNLLEAGAYAAPVGMAVEVQSIAGSVSQFEDNSIEIGVNRFSASEKAWNSLANMVYEYWLSSRALRRLVID